MPYFDGTGPNNQGPNTGRGFGFCTQQSAGKKIDNLSAKEELSWLTQRAQRFETHLQLIRQRIGELKK